MSLSDSASNRAPGTLNLPNALTVLRVVLVPVFAWLLLREGGEDAGSRIAAFVTFGIAALTDKADGEIARRRGQVTNFGKLADPIADKALIGTALIGLSVLGELLWWVTGLILLREFGITALRFAVIRYGVIAASRGGKAKTLLQVIAIALYLLPLSWWFAQRVAVVFMTAAVLVTVMTGLDYVAKAIRLRAGAAGARGEGRPGRHGEPVAPAGGGVAGGGVADGGGAAGGRAADGGTVDREEDGSGEGTGVAESPRGERSGTDRGGTDRSGTDRGDTDERPPKGPE